MNVDRTVFNIHSDLVSHTAWSNGVASIEGKGQKLGFDSDENPFVSFGSTGRFSRIIQASSRICAGLVGKEVSAVGVQGVLAGRLQSIREVSDEAFVELARPELASVASIRNPLVQQLDSLRHSLAAAMGAIQTLSRTYDEEAKEWTQSATAGWRCNAEVLQSRASDTAAKYSQVSEELNELANQYGEVADDIEARLERLGPAPISYQQLQGQLEDRVDEERRLSLSIVDNQGPVAPPPPEVHRVAQGVSAVNMADELAKFQFKDQPRLPSPPPQVPPPEPEAMNVVVQELPLASIQSELASFKFKNRATDDVAVEEAPEDDLRDEVEPQGMGAQLVAAVVGRRGAVELSTENSSSEEWSD